MYNNVFVSLETVFFLNDLFLFLFIPPNFNIVKYCNFKMYIVNVNLF